MMKMDSTVAKTSPEPKMLDQKKTDIYLEIMDRYIWKENTSKVS